MNRALVVGGSSAIGAAIAQVLLDLGYRVSLWGRSRQRLSAVQAALGEARVDVQVVDVTDQDALRAAAGAGRAAGDLRVMVWAAGVFDWGDADDADPGRWATVLDTNLTAAATTTALLLPDIAARPGGALLYIGSMAGHHAFAHNAAYVASKHGLTGLARAVWMDVRDRDVKVSLISPSLVAAGAGLQSPTAQNRPEHLLTPVEVAAAARFVLTFPGRGCPTEIRLELHHP